MVASLHEVDRRVHPGAARNGVGVSIFAMMVGNRLGGAGSPVREKQLRSQAAFDAGCQCMPLKAALMAEMPGSPFSPVDRIFWPAVPPPSAGSVTVAR
jgi:hypothetical protein